MSITPTKTPYHAAQEVSFRLAQGPSIPITMRGHASFTPGKGAQALILPWHPSPSQLSYPTKENRPCWLDAMHRLMGKIAKHNITDPVDPKTLKEIETIGNQLMQSDRGEQLIFMKLLSEFYFCGAKGIFFNALKVLRKQSPTLEQYFRDVETDERDEGPSLTAQGITQIFNLFETEFNFPKNALQTTQLSILAPMISSLHKDLSEGEVRGWVVRNDLMEEDPHVVPIYALKKNGKAHVFIFDSVGHTISEKALEIRISASLEEMIKHFGSVQDPTKLPSIYSYKTKRQHSELGCWAFSILDLKHLLERTLSTQSDLVDFFAAQPAHHRPRPITKHLAENSLLPIFEIDILPPEMMKVTQTSQGLKEYEANAPELAGFTAVAKRFTPKKEITYEPQNLSSLKKKLGQTQRTIENGKSRNLYVEQKRLQFIVYVLGLDFKQNGAALTTTETVRQLFVTDDNDDIISVTNRLGSIAISCSTIETQCRMHIRRTQEEKKSSYS